MVSINGNVRSRLRKLEKAAMPLQEGPPSWEVYRAAERRAKARARRNMRPKLEEWGLDRYFWEPEDLEEDERLLADDTEEQGRRDLAIMRQWEVAHHFRDEELSVDELAARIKERVRDECYHKGWPVPGWCA
jgi:hypothetical protein